MSEKRVRELIRKMTLEEKVKQLCCVGAADILEKGRFSRRKARKSIGKGMGQINPVLRGIGPDEGARLANEIQKFMVEETRLGVPVIIHDECLHGLMARGSTSYPQAIGLASTWDPALVEQVARAIGRETRTRGIQQVFTPTINIARDPRCGRTEETYGEDPCLTSLMAVSFVRGIQSQGVAATAKHFAANFVGDGGRDSHPVHFSERMLREIYFPAFRACVQEANVLSVMAAYGSMDGCPSSCDRWLLTDILRKEWGFKGIVVSDYGSVPGIYSLHNVAATKAEAGRKAIEAGLDVETPNIECFGELVKLVRKGRLSEKVVDESVGRVLEVKYRLGLFENPYVDPDHAGAVADCAEQRALAHRAARKSIVLLKNRGILPLRKNLRSIAVIGPNANTVRLGAYSTFGIKVITPLQGIKNKLAGNARILFSEGCKVKGKSTNGFKHAMAAAAKAEACLLFMGNHSVFGEKGSEGESNDRCDLDLPGVQEDLIKQVCAVNKNVIVVLISGGAVTMRKWADDVKAIVEAWYPGEEGGNAIADVIFGDCNPGGKLPITFPITTGQLPLYYNQKPTGRRDDYIDLRGRQTQFPFGYGLSYTTFDYKDLSVKKTGSGQKLQLKATFDVKNTGKRRGDEVVQLYVRDVVSSLSRPVKELKGFKRITLDPGEAIAVELILTWKDLSYLDARLKPVLEPGTFEVLVGSSSEDIRLKKAVVI